MKNFVRLFGCMLVIVLSLRADDVYMRTGSVLRNVRYIGIVKNLPENYYHFMGADRNRRIPMSNVLEIDSTVVYDPAGRSFMEQMPDSLYSKYGIIPEVINPASPVFTVRVSREDSIARAELVKNLNAPKREYPNLIWLSVSLLSALSAWEYTSTVSYLQSQIDMNNKFNDLYVSMGSQVRIDNAPIERAKTRAKVISILSTVACVTVTIHALESVQVKTDGNSLSMQYTF